MLMTLPLPPLLLSQSTNNNNNNNNNNLTQIDYLIEEQKTDCCLCQDLCAMTGEFQFWV